MTESGKNCYRMFDQMHEGVSTLEDTAGYLQRNRACSRRDRGEQVETIGATSWAPADERNQHTRMPPSLSLPTFSSAFFLVANLVPEVLILSAVSGRYVSISLILSRIPDTARVSTSGVVLRWPLCCLLVCCQFHASNLSCRRRRRRSPAS